MRFGNLADRLVLVTTDGVIDAATASAGEVPSDPQRAYEYWPEVLDWARRTDAEPVSFEASQLCSPIPRPRQVFAIGMNYASHATEVGLPIPEFPSTFTKFPSCVAGPDAAVTLPSDHVDWEVELVVVIGRRAHNVPIEAAWSHVAGLTIGQDLSERVVQTRPPIPQFSLGKSFPHFGPIGPFLVTVDEFVDPDDLELSCTLNGEEVQRARTSDLIFSVPSLISYLSSIVALLPGDLVFTGTPGGVGASRTPARFLRAGDELVSTIKGIGSLRTTFLAKEIA